MINEKLFGMSSYSHHDDEHFILNISIFHYVEVKDTLNILERIDEHRE